MWVEYQINVLTKKGPSPEDRHQPWIGELSN